MPPRISIDDIFALLDRTALSVPGASLLAVLTYKRARDIYGPALGTREFLRSHRWLAYLLAIVAIKTANRILTRLVRNNGWKADPPRWSERKGDGDVVLITGGSTGIGKEVVEILARKTSKIAVLDMAEPTYNAPKVKYYKCDVTDPKAIKEVADKIRAELGHPTIIYNNAGIARGNTILNTTPDQFMLTYKVNVLGAHNILREFLPHIISINHGHIVTTASSASYAAITQLSEYACSKAAVLALHEVLQQELVYRYNAPRVRTSVICPTKVSTQMGDAMKEQANQFLTPTLTAPWLANQMVEIVESGLSGHLIAPAFMKFGLPALRFFPDWWRWFINHAGKTWETITDEGNAAQKDKYKFIDQLDQQHGVAANK